MEYLYRYDSWFSHMNLFEDQLRARYWSYINKESWQHKSLMTKEEEIGSDQGIYRISFWKNLGAMLKHTSESSWTEQFVLQRIRADHPFFNEYKKEDDDFMEESAWLFWRVGELIEGRDWSTEGIPKADIEVLDIDGIWQSFENAH